MKSSTHLLHLHSSLMYTIKLIFITEIARSWAHLTNKLYREQVFVWWRMKIFMHWENYTTKDSVQLYKFRCETLVNRIFSVGANDTGRYEDEKSFASYCKSKHFSELLVIVFLYTTEAVKLTSPQPSEISRDEVASRRQVLKISFSNKNSQKLSIESDFWRHFNY